MNQAIAVSWSARSLRNAKDIKQYLSTHFSKKEVSHFETLLKKFEETVSLFPELYPASQKQPHLRKAVLHK